VAGTTSAAKVPGKILRAVSIENGMVKTPHEVCNFQED
jgi:hypothetical protein